MNICDERGHGQIVYEGRYCGACDLIKDLSDSNKRLLEDLRDAMEKLTVAYKTIEQMEDIANGKIED